jgi:long-chain acyl-CoA synthetase
VLRTDLIAPIPELLRRNAAARAAKIAYRDAETSVSYADLFDRTGRLAQLSLLAASGNDFGGVKA